MKNYKLNIFLFVFATILLGCEDQLERVPVDALVEETAYQSVSDLELGLSGSIGNYNVNTLIGFSSIFTDNCKLGVDNGGQELNTFNQILTPDQGDRGLWNSRYGLINDFNRLLAAAETITPNGDAEQTSYNNIIAQSLAFRALAHYEVLLYYGIDITNPSAEGVPYIDFVSTDAFPARNTTAEVLEGIQSDLTEASSLLPSNAVDINFVTQDFIKFLRARIALETEDYPTAISLSNDLIGRYPLATPAQYFDMFNEDADTTEVIWKYDNVLGFNYNMAGLWIFTGTGGGFLEMSNGLFAELSDTDIRKAVNVDPSSTIDDEIYIIGKYPPNADEQYINDFKAMRISEIYLIRAEAYARSQQFINAAADVFAVRNIRNGGTSSSITYGNLNQALTDILAERRLELAYEGHRYTDIKRMRSDLNIGIQRDPSDCPGGIPCSLPPSDERWIFPVPIGEINANDNMTQAPNY